MNTPAVPPNQTPWITTTAERTALGEPEARLTVSELRSLMLAAAELERAQRPIVLHSPETHPAPACQTATATHPGIDVRNPRPPVALAVATPKERSIWPLLFMTSACIGIGSCLVAATTGALIPVAVTLAAFATWGIATYQLVFVQDWK